MRKTGKKISAWMARYAKLYPVFGSVLVASGEKILYRHPAVMEACAIGVPDDKWGEAIKALVVLKKGQTATVEEIMGHCRESLSAYKKPQSVEFVTELPKNPNGKIARRSVRERFWVGKERRVN